MSDQPTTATVQSATASGGLYDFPEAAKLTGLTVDALRKRASRGRLEQVKGNDGTVRVRLTSADLATISRETSGHSPDMSGHVLTVKVNLHERAARAEGEATVLRDALARVQQQADVATSLADARLEALNVALLRTATVEERGKAEADRAATAEARIVRVEAELAEVRTPWIVRIIRAWRQ